jgi:PTH1 family peptidyl-tRNA hydrolase
MFLVAGLGNPGREHEGDRHNVGFVVVDAIAARAGADFRSKHQGLVARLALRARDVVLLKPQTYMNRSGDSVQPAAAFFKVAPGDVIVVHDEIDLPWGEVRLKLGGGHAGHNGLRDIIERLGTPDFVRVRVGVGRPASGAGGDGRASAWVLSGFDAAQRAELPGIVDRAVDAVERVLADGVASAMNAVNVRRGPG